MNLTVKLSFPLLIGLLLVMGYLHFYWEPHQLAKGKIAFIEQNKALLESSESALVRDILEENFAALVANVEYLLKHNGQVWLNMEIFANDGTRLYPLFDLPRVENGAQHDFVHQTHILHLGNSNVGKVVVDIDWYLEKQKIIEDVTAVRNMLLGTVLFSLLVILLIQLRIIVHPLVRLGQATRKITEGNLDIELPTATRDEVGALTRSFECMAQELSFRQRALDQHANVCITDYSGKITYINENFVITSGYQIEELLGENTRLLKSGLQSREFYEELWQTIAAGKIWQKEMCNRKKNGDYYWLDMTIVPQMGSDQQPERYIAISTDISKRKETEAELVEARHIAESANLAKSRFLANMSHEFRTPLNSVIGLTQMLTQRQRLGPGVREEVDKIHIAAQILLALVNDILDLSKIEAGEINLEIVPIQLEQVLRELWSLFKEQAEKKGLELVIGLLPAEAEGYLISDPTRLRQMLINLLNNAIKFTSSGRISLMVESLPVGKSDEISHSQRRFRFLVADTGAGIADDMLPRLFDAFRQADSSITRQYGGTGLGLAIVKQLCSEMGGDITVESTVGEGSCFALELPFRIATEDEVKEAGLYTKSFRIVIAEDDLSCRQNVLDICYRLGWNVEAVAGGEALVERCQKLFTEGIRVDCLLVDWSMPGLNALAVLQQIRKYQGPEKIPAILMVTADKRKEVQTLAETETVDLIVTKPLTISTLVNGLGQVMSHYSDDLDLVLRSSTLDFAHLAWLPDVKILVVDDAHVNLDLAVSLFTREGAEVFTCLNGAEALQWLQQSSNSVDIVLMDIQMPIMDGNTAVQKIRQIESLQDLPVIALTAAALASERKKSLDSGMDEYQTKPYDIEMMVRLIRRFVGMKRGIPVPVREKTGGLQDFSLWPDIEGIETDAVYERTNGDFDLFLDLLRRFTSEYGDMLLGVDTSAIRGEGDQFLPRMHKLAGSAGLIGALSLSRLARRVEGLLRDGGPEDEIRALLQQLTEEYRGLERALHPVMESREDGQIHDTSTSLSPVDLKELQEALQQKKILAAKIYRNIRSDLAPNIERETLQMLDQAMNSLDFTSALELLDRLMRGMSREATGETGEDMRV